MFDLDFQLKQMHLFFFSQEKMRKEKKTCHDPTCYFHVSFLAVNCITAGVKWKARLRR